MDPYLFGQLNFVLIRWKSKRYISIRPFVSKSLSAKVAKLEFPGGKVSGVTYYGDLSLQQGPLISLLQGFVFLQKTLMDLQYLGL